MVITNHTSPEASGFAGSDVNFEHDNWVLATEDNSKDRLRNVSMQAQPIQKAIDNLISHLLSNNSFNGQS